MDRPTVPPPPAWSRVKWFSLRRSPRASSAKSKAVALCASAPRMERSDPSVSEPPRSTTTRKVRKAAPRRASQHRIKAHSSARCVKQKWSCSFSLLENPKCGRCCAQVPGEQKNSVTGKPNFPLTVWPLWRWAHNDLKSCINNRRLCAGKRESQTRSGHTKYMICSTSGAVKPIPESVRKIRSRVHSPVQRKFKLDSKRLLSGYAMA
mmetsp:Transcript_107127/g.301504  ORF Transcript_107127/g.301504 Transcript_107127/m.301504 type:complete len:207 (+) Transcript_107127:491-1111(+)